jgi:hypothetical protein
MSWRPKSNPRAGLHLKGTQALVCHCQLPDEPGVPIANALRAVELVQALASPKGSCA